AAPTWSCSITRNACARDPCERHGRWCARTDIGRATVGNYVGALAENGQESVEQLIADGVDFDVILSINDAGAYGAIQALEAADIPPDSVVITSVDAEPLARDYIARNHYLRASVQIDRAAFSEAGINAVVRLMGGGAVPERILVPPGPVIMAANVGEATPEA
ncbi:MAG: substrate-binding domain-containing protein, partial [Blastochloris sp.]|nr:substrate-binding domain-containing protein [Blastochloris sp.]